MEKNIFVRLKKYIKCTKPRKMVDVLFGSYMLLIIVPILMLGSVFMMISAHQQFEQTQDIRVSVLDNTTEILRQKIDAIYNGSYDIMCNSDVLKFEEYGEYSLEKAFALSNIENSLQRVMAQTDIISEIYLYYKNTDMSVSASGEKRDFKKIYELFNMNRQEFCSFLDENNGKFVAVDSHTTFYGDKSYVMYIKSVDRKRKIGNIFEVCILDSKLVENIIESVNLDGAGSAMLLDENYNCMLQVGSKDLETVPDEDFLNRVSGEQYKAVKINGEKLNLLLRDVPLTDLKIFSAVKNSYYLMQFRYIWLLILSICAFIIAMGIWVARTYSRRIYQPITNIMNLFKPGNSDDHEKSELKFIESKFIEINEMHSELAEYKDTYSSYLKELFIYKFIKGYISDASDFRNKLNDFNVRIATEYYTALLVKIDRLEEVQKNIQMYHFQSYVKENFVHAFEKYCIGQYDSLHEFYDNEYIGIIICHDSQIEMEQCLKQIQEYIAEKLDITVSVCIGKTMVSWEELPATYEKLYMHMMQNRLCGYGFLKSVDEYNEQNKYINFNQYDVRINQCISKCDYDRLDSLIDEIFDRNDLMYNEIVQLFNSFIITLMGIINSSGYSANDILMNIKPYTDVEKFGTVYELCSYLKKICRMVAESIADSEKDKHIMLQRINEYFEQNYMKQITLETIAKEFGFSAGYFSRYFKEITGKKYIEFLNGYRIEKAKEIIRRDKTSKLLVISETVGFVRYRTFSDAFKKYEGQSPENFKRSL